LARGAASVLGLDLSPQTIAHARSRYNAANLRFEVADVLRLEQLPAASFDLIVSFETLEHLAEHDALLAGFARLLAPAGLLLISTPDKHNYTDRIGVENPHHVRELYRDQFEQLLGRHFAAHRLFAQKLLFQSVLWPVDQAIASVIADTAGADADRIEAGLRYPPLYYLAVCAAHADMLPPSLDGLVALFGDERESVYTHYNDEVGKHIAAGTRLAELEARLSALSAERDVLAATCAAREHATARAAPPAPEARGGLRRLWHRLRAR
jgi:ubiquinone/menaquinone biosynthesis C-methylase UbiE